MYKKLAAGAIALTIAGAGLALAQPGSQDTPRRGAERFRPSAADVAAFADARIAALKAGLKLTAEQEKHWPAVETALRELAKQRADRMTERFERREARRGGERDRAGADMIDRMRRGSDAMGARAASLKKLADASEPLYKSLDDGQKRRFAMLLRMGGRDGQGHGRHWQRRAESAR